MKLRPLITAALLLAVTPNLMRADTVTLKSGEKVEGTIIQDNDQQIEIEVQVSASIKDTKVFPKSDVASVEKAGADDLAYEEVKGFRVDPQNSLPAEAYDRIVAQLQDFQMRFPESKHAADVRTALTQFQQEREQVAAGNVKIFGRWLSKEEAEKNRFEIDAQQEFALMKQAASRGDYAGVLNGLAQMEKKYPGARVYPDAAELAIQVLNAINRDIPRRTALIAKQASDLQTSITMASEPRKSQLRAGAIAEQQRYENALAAADKAGLRWKPYIPGSQKSIDLYKSSVPSELARLSHLPFAAMRESVQLTDQAEAAIEKKDVAGAEGLLQQAQVKWSQSHALAQLRPVLAQAKAAATPTPTPQSANRKLTAEEEAKISGTAPVEVTVQETKPFFMTVPGAAAIFGGVLVLILLVNVAAKVTKKKEEQEK